MCIICLELAKGTITTKEGLNAIKEMTYTNDVAHLNELESKLLKEYANELSKEVVEACASPQLTFEDYVTDWNSEYEKK